MIELFLVNTLAVLSKTEELLGHFHLFLWYLPLVVFNMVLISDLLSYYGKLKTFTLGHWLVILGLITCIPTIMTGLVIVNNFDINDVIVSKHQFLGFTTGLSASLYAGLRISAMWWKLSLKPMHYVGLSLLMVALISWTNDYGMLIQYRVGK